MKTTTLTLPPPPLRALLLECNRIRPIFKLDGRSYVQDTFQIHRFVQSFLSRKKAEREIDVDRLIPLGMVPIFHWLDGQCADYDPTLAEVVSQIPENIRPMVDYFFIIKPAESHLLNDFEKRALSQKYLVGYANLYTEEKYD